MRMEFNEYALTRKEYFGFLVKNFIRKTWWMHLILWGYLLSVAVKTLFFGVRMDSFSILLFIFAIFYPASSLYSFWRYAGNEANPIYRPKRLIMDGENLEIHTFVEGEDVLRSEKILKIRRGTGGFLIDISKKQFVYLPVRAIQNLEDTAKIEHLLKS